MSFELAMLFAGCVLCLVQIVIASHAASFQRGYRWTASSRDVEVPPPIGLAGRLERALQNLLETFPVLWLRSCLFTCSNVKVALANGEPVSIFLLGWLTFCFTRQEFPCSARSSGASRSLDLSFFCWRQSGPHMLAFQP